jgi:hypothetical protein
MVYAVSETRIEQQTTMMKKGFKTLVLGSMKMFKINKIVTVVTIVMAMAATAFGVVSWDGGGDGSPGTMIYWQ